MAFNSRRDFLKSAAAWVGGVAAARAAAPWQIGCYTRPWDESDYRVALDGIAEAGYRYAGLMTHKGKTWVLNTVDTTPEESAVMGEEVRKRGMQTASVFGGGIPVQKSVEAGIQGLKRLIDNTAAARCPRLLLGGVGRDELVQPYYQAVRECCDYAASKGVSLSVKPHGGSNATSEQCRKVVEMVGKKNFGIWYDPGNIFFYSEGKVDPVDDVPVAANLIVGMSIKDYKPPKEVMVTPGTGRVNFPEVIGRARKGGFSGGPLIVECLTRGAGVDITAEARKARQLLERLTQSA